ncbi:hypothetical protein J7I98_35570 [Streptomyces sp. ISL-98]|uniref:hypothetical protein n=1 Tax=Streptomyces sp. ISL-98 TaxID=2819192 RepID=UPI001BEC01A1|nr:hypothetical protein [Streptomyces sp. ISL-98]MBT2511051.1 hypothetical protein [Streptomyces sp. ISL-98]
MNAAATVNDLAVPVRGLLAVCAEFGDLPAFYVGISSLYPKRLDLSLHDGLGSFELWRAALDIEAHDVRFAVQSAGTTWVLEGSTTYAGAELRLIAYGDAPQPLPVGEG